MKKGMLIVATCLMALNGYSQDWGWGDAGGSGGASSGRSSSGSTGTGS